MSGRWAEFHDLTRGQPPREFLLRAMPYLAHRDSAIDVGAGALNETAYLLDQGFEKVVAIDLEPLRSADAARFPPDRFRYVRTAFEDFQFPIEAFDLVNAQYALPFIRPTHFNRVFGAMRRSLKTGGVFTAQLFGDRDEWASFDRRMTFHPRRRARALFERMELLEFEEEEEDGETADGYSKHWHVFNIIARK